jgi:hypothetical protein
MLHVAFRVLAVGIITNMKHRKNIETTSKCELLFINELESGGDDDDKNGIPF